MGLFFTSPSEILWRWQDGNDFKTWIETMQWTGHFCLLPDFIPGIANHFPFSIENWFHAKSSFRQVVNVMIDRILACNNSKLKEGNVLAWNSYQVNYFYISFLTTCRMFLQPRRKVSEKFWKSCCTIPLQKLFGRRTKFPAEFHIFANAI